jgi:hexosaminidase
MKKLYLISIIIAVFSYSCSKPKIKQREISIIPKPVELNAGKGNFFITKETTIIYPDINGIETIAFYLKDLINQPTGYNLITKKHTGHINKGNTIIFKLSDEKRFGDEGYSVDVTKENVTITATKPSGLFHGVQTVLQLLPAEIYSPEKVNFDYSWNIPEVKIFDKPIFKWRGMHLDVSRHFFPAEFIKRYIDLIAMHKMNIFHWHLTDDNGWRIEIKKYPELTDICAWRVARNTWRGAEPAKPGEKPTYGGFYTQEEIKDIVNYAAMRSIEIIPEIEMPGHAQEVFAAFPQLNCEEKKTSVPIGWGGLPFCAGNDSVFVFLENVLDEIVELFPSKYIHIGGDEVDKRYWEKCSKCQNRIKENNLKNENELQSWFVKRIENYLTLKGKRLIGWDEILEGGLAPEATVMSWRGTNGGIESAKQGHEVIMCPGSHCYFDHYQAEHEFEPEAIGGYTPLKKVYTFNPIPKELSKKEARFILGGQGNVWTEFIFTPEQVEYMAVPRMCALAEVLWTPDNKQNWPDFRKRLKKQFERFEFMKVNYSRGSFLIDIRLERDADGSLTITLESEQMLPEQLHYTLDGTDPTKQSPVYKEPLRINSTTTIKAAFIDERGKPIRLISSKTITMHKALGKNIELSTLPANRYKTNGSLSLIDGLNGSENFNDGYWLGFEGKDMKATIDLGKMTEVHSVKETFYQGLSNWIFLPEKVTFTLVNDNNKVVGTKTIYANTVNKTNKILIEPFTANFGNNIKAKYVRVNAYSLKVCPEWHPAKGKKCWIFTDEIIVE